MILADGRPLDADRIEQLTGGNAFFVTEMLEHAGEDLPVSVRDAILARTTNLDAEAWEVVHLLACAPEAIPDDLLAILGVGIRPLRALDHAGLIARGPRGVTFRHDLCRLAIAGTIPPGGEVAMHRRMLDALESSASADPSVLTHHALGAGDPVRLLRYATEAARAATRSGARRQSAALLRLALDRGALTSSAQQAELLEWLAEECYLIDQIDSAIDACDRAMSLRLRSGDVAGVSSNHHALSVYHWYNADRPGAERHATDAIAVVDEPTAAGGQGLVHLGHGFAMQAYLAMHSSDIADAQELVEVAAQISERSGDHALAVRSRLIEGICRIVTSDETGRDAVLSLLDKADDDFDEIYSMGYSNLTYLDVEQRRLSDAAAVLSKSLLLAIEREMPICRVWQLGARARMRMLEGEWEKASGDAEQVLAGESAPLTRTWPHLVRGLVSLRRMGQASTDIDSAWDLACRYGEDIRVLPAAAAIVEQAWLTGLDDTRLATCRTLLGGDIKPGLEWARGDLAVWLWRLDRTIDVAALLDHVAEPYQLQLSGRHGDAAALWDELSCAYERALALVETDEVEEIRAGVELLDKLGADAVAAKVRLDLRERGIATVPARRRRSTRTNHAGLTHREIEVLGLLDEGLTNAELAERLYISAKTVDHHVSSILAKLHVANRRDAVRSARKLNLIS